MSLQLLGAFVLMVLAVYITNEIAAFVKLREISPVYIFAIVFVIFSNLWTFAMQGLSLLRQNYYPGRAARKVTACSLESSAAR